MHVQLKAMQTRGAAAATPHAEQPHSQARAEAKGLLVQLTTHWAVQSQVSHPPDSLLKVGTLKLCQLLCTAQAAP